MFYKLGNIQALNWLGINKSATVLSDLQPHQQRVVDRMLNQPGLVVAHGLGSGKTLSSIAVADALGLPTTVLVPASLQTNYKKELEKHTDSPPADLTISSLQKAVLQGETPSQGLLIIDEAHRIREPATKGYGVLSRSGADKRLLLTASPVYNHPSDIAPLVNIAAGTKLLPATKRDFEDAFIDRNVVNPGLIARIFRGIKPGERPTLANTAHLKPILNQWVDYHENPPTQDFPTRQEKWVQVQMGPEQQEVYDALLDKAPAWVSYKVRKGLPPSKREAQLINAFLTTQRQVSGNIRPFVDKMAPEDALPYAAKANAAFKSFTTRLNANKQHKALVYSNYLDAGLEPYELLLQQNKIPYGKFTGDISKKKRDQMVQDYNANKLKALLVSSAGGEGLDLKGTRQIQILDPHWNNEKIEQVIGRGIRYKSHAHLPKRDRNVQVERYIATSTPKPNWWQRLLKKKPEDSSADQTTDQYLKMLSDDKDALNAQLRKLL